MQFILPALRRQTFTGQFRGPTERNDAGIRCETNLIDNLSAWRALQVFSCSPIMSSLRMFSPPPSQSVGIGRPLSSQPGSTFRPQPLANSSWTGRVLTYQPVVD